MTHLQQFMACRHHITYELLKRFETYEQCIDVDTFNEKQTRGTAIAAIAVGRARRLLIAFLREINFPPIRRFNKFSKRCITYINR